MQTARTLSITLLLLMVGGFLFYGGYLLGGKNPIVEVKPYFNKHLYDCMEQKGEYVLSFKEDSDMNYEWCKIEQKIDYGL
jgi:hypothetical protein